MQFLVAAYAAESAIFKEPQQLGLQRAAHISDLIEENGSAVRFLHATQLQSDSSGKGSLFMSEEFAFQQGFGDGPRS
jgi:hypothetical protein